MQQEFRHVLASLWWMAVYICIALILFSFTYSSFAVWIVVGIVYILYKFYRFPSSSSSSDSFLRQLKREREQIQKEFEATEAERVRMEESRTPEERSRMERERLEREERKRAQAKAEEMRRQEREKRKREQAEREERERHEREQNSQRERDTRRHGTEYQWCYTLLGLSTSASLKEIEVAYKHKAKIHHPDHAGDGDIMRMLNEARDKLRELHRMR